LYAAMPWRIWSLVTVGDANLTAAEVMYA
jgi:hypothetical protein